MAPPPRGLIARSFEMRCTVPVPRPERLRHLQNTRTLRKLLSGVRQGVSGAGDRSETGPAGSLSDRALRMLHRGSGRFLVIACLRHSVTVYTLKARPPSARP